MLTLSAMAPLLVTMRVMILLALVTEAAIY